MKYWPDLQSKWGFNDGELYPAGVEVYRDVYLRVVNRLAELLSSNVRIIPHDLYSSHNSLRLAKVSATWFYSVFLARQSPGELWSGEWEYHELTEVEADEALEEAVAIAESLDLDDLVEATVRPSPELGLFIRNLEARPEIAAGRQTLRDAGEYEDES